LGPSRKSRELKDIDYFRLSIFPSDLSERLGNKRAKKEKKDKC
jgi:hypothetical protein